MDWVNELVNMGKSYTCCALQLFTVKILSYFGQLPAALTHGLGVTKKWNLEFWMQTRSLAAVGKIVKPFSNLAGSSAMSLQRSLPNLRMIWAFRRLGQWELTSLRCHGIWLILVTQVRGELLTTGAAQWVTRDILSKTNSLAWLISNQFNYEYH